MNETGTVSGTIIHDLRNGRGPTENGKRDAWVNQRMQDAAGEIERLQADNENLEGAAYTAFVALAKELKNRLDLDEALKAI